MSFLASTYFSFAINRIVKNYKIFFNFSNRCMRTSNVLFFIPDRAKMIDYPNIPLRFVNDIYVINALSDYVALIF